MYIICHINIYTFCDSSIQYLYNAKTLTEVSGVMVRYLVSKRVFDRFVWCTGTFTVTSIRLGRMTCCVCFFGG